MAINPNTGHTNKNTLYLACSGGGKSQALMQNKSIPYRNARVLLWDIDLDHRATRFENISEFHRAVIAGVRSGRGFRIAFSGNDTLQNFATFNRIAWACLDGNKKTFIIIEELADVTPSIGKAEPEFGKLLRKGRKFGAELHVTSQRGAEIPKTAYTQCLTKYIGQQQGRDVKNMAEVAGVSPAQITGLKSLEFFLNESGPEPGKLVKFRYKKP